MTTSTPALPGAVADYVNGANAFDLDQVMTAFAPDAMVNDARREFWGADAVKGWLKKEMIGDRVTLQVTRVVGNDSDLVMDAVVDGSFDKTNLPDPIVLTHYIAIREAKITQLIIILNAAPTG